ncbi:DNA-directed RNA polymerase I subunit RPA1 [Athalia rosae]|uniref:DNA-directed RNA polymerase I subunit RPA1 n=1 Tax=Athalia rosae TaxID=37344 RepID=UPI0020338991|nr:DNA-directed RNA polymerase I subunit RPA1 [Athalia rosae]XP_012257740.2 DNA-directed RNA polymerase I subunit RPA1 [Athalia rosae]XP_048513923.1 DNA-directed RNA polymerase I subunit RPA1 [Athalia rosae]
MQRQSKPNIRMSVKHHDPQNLTFSMFTAEDIRNLSVTKISTPLSFNVLGHPLKGGLYDPALGPLSDRSDPCGTCGGNIVRCSGHFGHIELPVPVVNPLFHKQLWTLIRLSCLSCFKLQISSRMKLLLVAKIKLLEEGCIAELEELTQEIQHIISSMNEEEGAEEFVRETIDAFMENMHNRQRFNHNVQLASQEDNATTKNTNIQRFVYIDNTLKQFRAGNLCLYCQCAIPKVKSFRNKIMTTKSANLETSESIIQRGVVRRLNTVLIMPDQSQEYLRQLWLNEADLLRVIMPCLNSTKIEHPTDIMFLKAVAVLPPLVRPVNYLQGQMIEHPQSQVYKSIIQDCLVLRNIIQTIQDGNTSQLPEEGRLVFDQIRGNSAVEKLHNAWEQLQTNVDHVMDRDMNKTTQSASCQGLKQVIEKKEGIIRMHMMGKRVNFAARSVITPDPNLSIDEIGIPEAFALKLTYPVPVTPWNVAELRKMILNGPNVHPGAVMVENEDGSVKRLCATGFVAREAIAKRLLTTSVKAGSFFRGTKIVHRHLQNGDVLLLNRQPTLHKPSIMAHKARILKGEKTLRLHYANCKAYNADFDGDEMNAHFPQNELARSEGYNIANVSNQYLVPKDGTPLSGLIQDHMVSGVRLTLRGKFFSREDYMQLVYSALTDVQGDLILLPPAIIKPKLLWSGKQILSTVIINATPRGRAKINLTASAKIGPKAWETRKPRRWKCGTEFDDPKTMSEAEVIIRNGELLCGVLDKIHYGATPYGLIHCVYELYGGAHSSKLLSAFGKLFQSHLQREGFTLGIEDILILPNAGDKRTKFIKECRTIGESTQKAALEVPDDTPIEEVKAQLQKSYLRNPKFQAIVDRKYKTALDVFTNDINKTCLPAGLFKKFPDNNLQLMVQSGAKGSTVNTMQISCLLGQIELEGKRPPLMISGKSLPAFAPYDPTPRAGGFIDGRFMTGIQPQEFFFHCMAGREGLIDTAVKTSRSGYLQRCLIKHLEGLTVSYDSTVRDSDGSLIQLNYGEDGLDVPSSQFLKKEQLDFLVDNKNAILEPELLNGLRDLSTQKILKIGRKIQKWVKKHGSPLQKRRTSEFVEFCTEHSGSDVLKHSKIIESCGRSKGALILMKKWIKSDEETKLKYKDKCTHCPDPLFSRHTQDSNYGVLTERVEGLINDYLSSKRSPIDKDQLRDILSLKVMKSLCQPGEPVGLLAAQSIGEPSTQMTLNTFHFAGRGEMNVTLGIPRLREILMMASQNIKTPSMEIPFKSQLPKLEKRADKLRLKLTRCTLANVLTNVNVDGCLELWPQRRMVYTLTMQFLRRKSYKREYSVQPIYVLTKTENSFFRDVFREIKKSAKASGALLHVEEDKKPVDDDQLDANESEISDANRRRGRLDLGETHESSDEDEPAEDADATTARSIARHQENQEYEDPEEASDESDDEIEDDDDDEAAEAQNEEKQEKDEDEADDLDVANRRKKVIDMYPNAIDYEFDKKKYLSCKLKFWLPLRMAKLDLSRILRTVAEKVVLWETPLIRRAFTFQNASDETILKTDGLNIVEMFKYNEILELNRLYSNDIYGISQTYGIEAANRVIVKEVKDVFKMYGITVDPRHLLLIADYMTFDGTFQPLSRKGMENSASPLQQISFESSLTFMKNAAVQNKKDDLSSPSSRLMLGQPCKSGTGLFTLMNRMDAELTAQ